RSRRRKEADPREPHPCPPPYVGGYNRDRSEAGVVLVITLILLAVITFMAVTFMVVSHSHRGAGQTEREQKNAALGTEAAKNRAISELLSRIMANNNAADFDLLVPTNYVNTLGFVPGNTSFTNVNYDYTITRTPLSQGDLLQNLANLQLDPRP